MVKKISSKKEKLSPDDKKARLEEVMALNNKKYGRQVLKYAKHEVIERIPFKCDKFNEVSGGGVPIGRFNIIWGPKGSTKSSSCYDLVSNAQAEGKICAWFDYEQSFHSEWASVHGVDVENLVLCNEFNTAEEGMDMIINMAETEAVDLIIIDSIQGLSPTGEQETKKGIVKDMKDDTMALLARKLSEFFRRTASRIARAKCTIVLIGQNRTSLGSFITFDKLSGGNALEHWSSLTLAVRRGQKANAPAVSKKTGNPVKGSNPDAKYCGFEVVMKVEKSKVGPDEMKEARALFYYGEGFKEQEIIGEETE